MFINVKAMYTDYVHNLCLTGATLLGNFIVGPNFTTAPREHVKVARVRLKAVDCSIKDSKF